MKRKIILKVLLHLFFWVICFWYFTTNSFLRFPSLDYYEEYFSISFIIILIYFNSLYLIPHFFNRQQFFAYFSFLILVILLFTSLEFLMLKDDIKKIAIDTGDEFQKAVFFWNYFGILFRDALFAGFFTMFKIYRDAIKTNTLLKEIMVLEKQKMQAEINRVKTKVNAHFFFNTLNTIYAQALEHSEKTADMVVSLSDLMRYVVSDSEYEWVALDKEIEFLQNYIALETERHQQLNVNFEIQGDSSVFNVPPMIFEAFVNNAFKYTDDEGRGYVHIQLECKKDAGLVFSCRNNTRTTTPARFTSTSKGLQNTSERLQLFYNNKFHLKTGLENGIYSVRLELFK